jgi:hypothetical protein
MLRRLTVSLKRDPALTATRIAIGKSKLVYLLVTDKRLRYSKGRSRIAYIGTTKRGIGRVAGSAAHRAADILALRGVRSFTARIVTCPPRQKIATWTKMERALLITFRERFGDVPHCNSHGKKMRPRDVFQFFQKRRLLTIIDELS